MRWSATAALVAALLVCSGLVAGCSSDDIPSPGAARIDVDTPQLRTLRTEAGIEACEPGTGAPVDHGLPDVTLPCLGGGEDVDLAGLRGPLVVNLWASWCGPCVKEMPEIAAFYERYGDQVPVIGIDYQDNQTAAAFDLAKRSGVTYPLLADTQGDLQAKPPFAARIAVPSFAFVAEDGTVTLELGRVKSVDDLVGLVEKHLGVRL
ncbi:TlpA family protein disulfide reductase [Nocardioides sp. URHA0020]|uniref:TlpA family protein disulfide reductase n=1 Tax=Nocardioides sp. URHA0020 TaxID=1380392 RepID=UPI000684204F|nr:TlpA disulfide reductase family protein [Nocardioides sp. URHA0020]